MVGRPTTLWKQSIWVSVVRIRITRNLYRPLNSETLDFVTPQKPVLDRVTRCLTSAINANAQVRALIRHPKHDELSFLYSAIVTFSNVPVKEDDPKGITDWQET